MRDGGTGDGGDGGGAGDSLPRGAARSRWLRTGVCMTPIAGERGVRTCGSCDPRGCVAARGGGGGGRRGRRGGGEKGAGHGGGRRGRDGGGELGLVMGAPALKKNTTTNSSSHWGEGSEGWGGGRGDAGKTMADAMRAP